MKKTKLTRSLLAACSIVALSVALSACVHSGDDDEMTMDMMPVDTDGDGVADADDAFPMDADETADADMDGVGDNADTDDDNDGVADADDAFPNDAMESVDTDGDGMGNNADTDDDGDGVADADDAFPLDATETADADGDGMGDVADLDDDNDDVADVDDAFPNDAMESVDTDGDGMGNNADTDDDGDGVADADDAFPLDSTETADLDGDGTGDNADTDRDGDGRANVADDFPDDATETRDSDGDGVGNNADAFPFDDTETVDSDGDGVGDVADVFPNDATETLDTDMDGVGNNADAFPGQDDRVTIRLFQAANGYHVMDDPMTMANETAVHVASVGTAIAGNAVVASGDQTGSTTASATWAADTLDDPATTEVDEFMAGTLMISVDPGGGGAIPFNLMAVEADPDADPAVDAVIQTARMIHELGAFQGYELWENDGMDDTTTDRARAIVFTDKEQGTHATAGVSAVTARTLTNAPAANGTVTDLGSQSGDTYTGVTFFEAGADTEDSGVGFMGTLTCAAGVTCSATTNADGTVTVSGYTFTGTRALRAGTVGTGNTENNDYLMFGVWLDENEDGTTDTFGAFASGGTDYAVNVQNAVTGTASYSGEAVGAHHMTGAGVNWFEGDASLTADFGADDAPGTISGEISNIRVAGGEALADSIILGQAALTDGNAEFNGAAVMGDQLRPGSDMHEYNGTWSGEFFGATADDDTTTTVTESVTAPLAAAGTFGVTRTEGMGDDEIVESFVGAFGAHLDD